MAYVAGIVEERNVKTFPSYCEGAIEPYSFVKAGTANIQVEENDAANGFCLGVSGNGSENGKATYEDGDPIAVKYGEIVYLKMAGSGSYGNRVVSNASAQGIAHTTADGVNVFGYAMQDWTVGMIIPILVDRCYIGDTVPA